MKTDDELNAAIAEIADVCRKHGIALIGTCNSEGINGEITIIDAANNWCAGADVLQHWRDQPYVESIGSISAGLKQYLALDVESSNEIQPL